jgi:hypothetical protein
LLAVFAGVASLRGDRLVTGELRTKTTPAYPAVAVFALNSPAAIAGWGLLASLRSAAIARMGLAEHPFGGTGVPKIGTAV